MSAEERRRTAYHESGHALVGLLTPGAGPVRMISIAAGTPSIGVAFSAPECARLTHERDELEARINVALGGRVAEELVFFQPSPAAEADRRELAEFVRRVVGRWGRSERIVEECHTYVLALLHENSWRLDSLASALLKYEVLDQSMVYAAAGLSEPGSAPGAFTAAAFGARRRAA